VDDVEAVSSRDPQNYVIGDDVEVSDVDVDEKRCTSTVNA
jgi:hypothetical protein